MKEYSEYIVSYDITINKIRNKIEQILKDAGLQRIQYSVFYGRLPSDRLGFIYEKLKVLERKATHSIMIFIIKNGAHLEKITI